MGFFATVKRRFTQPKMTKAERKALKAPRTKEDNLQDAIEAYVFITDLLIGALIEPDRDKEAWVRKKMREALEGDSLRRVATKDIIWNAQRKESAFLWLKAYHETFTLSQNREDMPAEEYFLVDFNKEVMRNI